MELTPLKLERTVGENKVHIVEFCRWMVKCIEATIPPEQSRKYFSRQCQFDAFKAMLLIFIHFIAINQDEQRFVEFHCN